MLGMSAFMDWRVASKSAEGIMWFGISGVLGWPFASALVGFFLLEEVIVAFITSEATETVRRFIDGVVRSFVVMVRSF